MSTDKPVLRSALAAANPETPAPMMTTSHEAFAISPNPQVLMPTLNIHTGLQCTMPNLATHRIPLAAHPATQSGAIKSLDVQIFVPSRGILTLGYTLHADMSQVRVGPPTRTC